MKFYLLYSYIRALYKLSPAFPAFCSVLLASFLFSLPSLLLLFYLLLLFLLLLLLCSTRIKFIVNASSSSSNLAKTNGQRRYNWQRELAAKYPVHLTNGSYFWCAQSAKIPRCSRFRMLGMENKLLKCFEIAFENYLRRLAFPPRPDRFRQITQTR